MHFSDLDNSQQLAEENKELKSLLWHALSRLANHGLIDNGPVPLKIWYEREKESFWRKVHLQKTEQDNKKLKEQAISKLTLEERKALRID